MMDAGIEHLGALVAIIIIHRMLIDTAAG